MPGLQPNMYCDQDGVPPQRGDSRVEDRPHRYGIDERCGYPFPMCRPVPVTDETVLGCAWTKTADEILDKVASYCRRISDSGHQGPHP